MKPEIVVFQESREDRIPYTYAHAMKSNTAYMKAGGYRCRKCKTGYSFGSGYSSPSYEARKDGTIYFVCNDSSKADKADDSCDGELEVHE